MRESARSANLAIMMINQYAVCSNSYATAFLAYAPESDENLFDLRSVSSARMD